jgi:hypothetical protein
VTRTLNGVDFFEDYSSPIWFTSNDVKIGKFKANRKKGTGTLSVEVPGPGTIVLNGKHLARKKTSATEAGTVKLKVKPKGKLKRKLAKRGKAKVKAKVAFTPDGGIQGNTAKKLKLKRKPHKG